MAVEKLFETGFGHEHVRRAPRRERLHDFLCVRRQRDPGGANIRNRGGGGAALLHCVATEFPRATDGDAVAREHAVPEGEGDGAFGVLETGSAAAPAPSAAPTERCAGVQLVSHRLGVQFGTHVVAGLLKVHRLAQEFLDLAAGKLEVGDRGRIQTARTRSARNGLVERHPIAIHDHRRPVHFTRELDATVRGGRRHPGITVALPPARRGRAAARRPGNVRTYRCLPPITGLAGKFLRTGGEACLQVGIGSHDRQVREQHDDKQGECGFHREIRECLEH